MARELDQIYGFGYVRTAQTRHTRTVAAAIAHRRHRPPRAPAPAYDHACGGWVGHSFSRIE
jgi:hypothetical protein